MITKEQAKNYCEEYAAGDSAMGTIKSLWQSLLFYCLPNSEHLVWSRDSNRGEYDVPSDDTAIRAASTMAAGIYSYTVTRGSRIADLSVQDPELQQDDEINEYLSDKITKATYLVQSSNFASAIYEVLRYFSVLGTDVLFSYYDTGLQKLNFRSYRAFDCWMEEGASGRVNRIIRKETIKHKVALERWGRDKLPEKIKEEMSKPEGVVLDSDYLHIVEPNPDYIPYRAATGDNVRKAAMSKHFKYREIWIHPESYTVMSEGSGFRTFPYHVARSGIRVNNLPFGRSTAMDALPTIRQLHRASQWMTDASECELRPPTILPKGSMDPADWDDRPAARITYNPIENHKPERLSTVVSIEPMFLQMQSWQEAIDGFFFVPLFQSLDQIHGSNPTATHVQEAAKQGIQGIAPIIGSLEPEVYMTVVERVLDLMDLYNLGPTEPDILNGKDIVINVTSQLDAELQNTDVRRMLVALGQSFEIMRQFTENPEMHTLADRDSIIRNILYTNNVDPESVFSSRESLEKQKELEQAQTAKKLQEEAMSKVGMVDPMRAPEPGSMAEGGIGV